MKVGIQMQSSNYIVTEILKMKVSIWIIMTNFNDFMYTDPTANTQKTIITITPTLLGANMLNSMTKVEYNEGEQWRCRNLKNKHIIYRLCACICGNNTQEYTSAKK